MACISWPNWPSCWDVEVLHSLKLARDPDNFPEALLNLTTSPFHSHPALTLAAINIMDSRAHFRIDFGFYAVSSIF